MKPVLVFGAGQIGEVFAEYLELNHFSVRAFVVDDQFMHATTFGGKPVVPLSCVEAEFSPEAYQFVIGLSFKGRNGPRAERFETMRVKGYEALTFVDRNARVSPSARIGAGCVILDNNVIQTRCWIGDNVVMWSGNHVGHHSCISAHAWLCSHVVVSGAVKIGERSFLGVNSTVVDGKHVGKECVIGANALIVKDCADFGVYPGQMTERSAVPSYRARF